MILVSNNHKPYPRLSSVKIDPKKGNTRVWQARTVLEAGPRGWIEDQSHGLFVCECRVLSRWRLMIDGKVPELVVHSNVQDYSWLAYYISAPPGIRTENSNSRSKGSGLLQGRSQQTLETKIARFIGDGMHEDLDLTNYTLSPTSQFDLQIEVDADFAALAETDEPRKQHGKRTVQWLNPDPHTWELRFDYTAQHHFQHQDESGDAQLWRGLIVRIRKSGSPPQFRDGTIVFPIQLSPRESWHCCLELIPIVSGRELEPEQHCESFAPSRTRHERMRSEYLQGSARFVVGPGLTLAPVVEEAVERAKSDLASLRLYDVSDDAWVPAAGVPLYIALFGRDTITAGWQSAMADVGILKGALMELAKWQAHGNSDWRDEQPGRMLHEAHTSPLAQLGFNPRAKYYGSLTASSFYAVALGEYWHWTGDKKTVGELLDPALKAIAWLDRVALLDNGFYGYKTRSEQGVERQSWKDSGDSMVHEDGSQAESPVATCEEQAYVYAAKLRIAGILMWFGKVSLARKLYREAEVLRRRFNQAYWMPDLGFYSMGIDAKGRLIRSIADNALHAMAAGIINSDYAQRTAERLMQPDLFSGWGVRTLSSSHPAYDPYSYHRGTVWPTEAAAMALGFKLYGLSAYAERVCRSQFETIQLFDFYRFPEVISGHQRDQYHPLPALYPQTCSPQAWSSSAVFCLIQALLGIYPYAPLNMLLIDPELPEWLPQITLEDLRVGDATASIRFWRRKSGATTFRVLKKTGSLHVLRQPSPWSVRAGVGSRAIAAVSSMFP